MPSTLDRFVPDEEKDLFVPDPEEEGYESVTPEDEREGRRASLAAEISKLRSQPPASVVIGSPRGIVTDIAKQSAEKLGTILGGLGTLITRSPGLDPAAPPSLQWGPAPLPAKAVLNDPLRRLGEDIIAGAQNVQVPEGDQSAITHDIVSLGTGLGPYAIAPQVAPLTMALESIGSRDIVGDIENLKAKGVDEEEAVRQVVDRAVAGGMALGSVWGLLPAPLKKVADKLVRAGSISPVVGFGLRRASGAAQMGTTAGAGYLAEKAAAGEPITLPELTANVTGGAELGLVMPQGPTARPERKSNAIQEQGANALHVRETPENRQAVVQGVSEPQAAAGAREAKAGPESTPTQGKSPLGNLNEAERVAFDLGKQRGEEVHFVDELPPGAPPNAIAVPGPNGQTLVKRSEYNKWLKERKATPELVESLLDEEMFHGLTPNDVALDYHNSMTAAERALALRRYAGPASARRAAGIKLTPTQLGHEAIRFDWQKLSGKTPREILEAKGMEWLTVQGITALERTIAASRRALGTKASRRQRELLNEQAKRVAAARQLKGLPPTNIPESAPQEDIDENRPFALNKDKTVTRKDIEETKPEEVIDTITSATPSEMGKMWGKFSTEEGGLTAAAKRIGERVAGQPESIKKLAQSYLDSNTPEYWQGLKTADADAAAGYQVGGQLIGEALEAATGAFEVKENAPEYNRRMAKAFTDSGLPVPTRFQSGAPPAIPTATPAPTPAIRAPMPRMAPGEAPRFEGMSDALRRRMEARAQREATGEAPPAALNKEGKERTLTPAIRLGNRWFTGKSHAEALQKATKEIKSLTPDEQMDLMSDPEHQFLDENGNPLNRKQAAQSFFELTGKRPAREEGLHSEDLRDAGLLKHLEEAPPAAFNKRIGSEEPDEPLTDQAKLFLKGLGVMNKELLTDKDAFEELPFPDKKEVLDTFNARLTAWAQGVKLYVQDPLRDEAGKRAVWRQAMKSFRDAIWWRWHTLNSQVKAIEDKQKSDPNNQTLEKEYSKASLWLKVAELRNAELMGYLYDLPEFKRPPQEEGSSSFISSSLQPIRSLSSKDYRRGSDFDKDTKPLLDEIDRNLRFMDSVQGRQKIENLKNEYFARMGEFIRQTPQDSGYEHEYRKSAWRIALKMWRRNVYWQFLALEAANYSGEMKGQLTAEMAQAKKDYLDLLEENFSFDRFNQIINQSPSESGEQAFPAALRKGKKAEEDKAQMGLVLPPSEKREDRPTAQELGAVYVPPAGLPTAKALSDAATTHLTESKRPSFNNFVAEVQDQYGEGVQPGQLKELWQDAVWQRLMTAKGSELESLRDSLGLHESLGGGTIEDAPEPTVKGEGNVQARREALLNQVRTLERRAEEAEAQLASQKERMASGSPMDRIDAEALVPTYEKSSDALRRKAAELTSLARNAAPEDLPPVKPVRPELGTFFQPGVSQRLRAMARIGEKLIGQSEPQATRLRRKEITPNDLGFWRTREGEPEAFEPIGPEMARSPDLGRRLTSGASMERTGRRAPPESVTKRVTALLDNLNGKVHLVDTYRKGTGEVLLFDPRRLWLPKPHSTIDSVLGEKLSDGRPRFVPLDSYLLDEPVQNFHQTFPSQKEYKAALRDPARDMLREREYSSAERPAIPEEVPAPSVMRTGEPLTDAEARRVYDYFASEEPQGIADVQASLERLFEENRPRDPQTGEPRALNSRELAVVNALDKAIQASPEKGEIQALNRFLVDLYENIARKGRTREEWIKTVTPTVPKPGGEVPAPASAEAAPPAAIRKPTAKESLDRKIAYYRNGVAALLQRRFVKEDVARLRDATENEARISGQNAERAIRLRVKDDLEDAAVIVMRQTRMTPDNAFFFQKLDEFKNNVNAGMELASAEKNRKAIKKGEQMLAAIDYVRKYAREDENAPMEDRLRSRRLRDSGNEAFSQTKKIFDTEAENGVNLRFESGYIPQRYDAERFNDDVIEFGEQRVLGRAYKKARVFRDYFEAFREGYLPKDFRASVVIGSRVRDGMRAINKKLWIDAFKTTPDPVSGEFIIRDLERKEVRDAEGNLLDVERTVPDPEHDEVELAPGKRYAIRRAYAPLFRAMTAKSSFQTTPVGKAFLNFGWAQKHMLLGLDTFHVGRMTAMGLSVLGRKMGYEKGRSILEYAPEDLWLAVKRGEVPRETISWALDIDPDRIVEGPRGKIDFEKTPRMNRNLIEVNDITLPIGAKAYWTRYQSAKLLLREGMNVGRIEDQLYRDFSKHIPVIGTFSKWVFDKLTRGVMIEAGLHEFERLNRAKPNLTPQQIAKSVAKDVNVFFGNLGRQGLIKNPFLRDLLQVTFLAPQWVESLAQKEFRALSRTAAAPFRGKEAIKFGTIGKGMGAGIGAMVIAVQLLNLILSKFQTGKAQFTWQSNADDPEHLLDARIPDVTGRTKGLWFSPFSLHAELGHDLWRYSWNKDQEADAVLQIAENKLGPASRSLLVFGSGFDPIKGKLESTWSRSKAAAFNLIPMPIGVGPAGRTLGHKLLPNLVEANKPGAVQRQALGSFGIKTEFAKSPIQEMGRKAAQWLKAEGRPRTEIVRSADLPSYSRLRDYIRNGDQAHAFQMMDELLKTHNYNQIKTAMERHRDAPFTGSKELEKKFRNSLTEREQNLYDEAKEQQKDEFLEFMDILRQHRDRP